MIQRICISNIRLHANFLSIYFLTLVSFFSGSGFSAAQGLSAFINVKKEFFVFDDSVVKKIDYLKPQNFKIGGNCIAYIDDSKSFKVYHNGKMIKVNDGFTTDYAMTNNYVFMKNNTSIHVFDNGKATFLTRNPESYLYSDSMIGYADPLTHNYYLYTGGKIITLIEDLIRNPIGRPVMGDNVFAYATVHDSLYIYYRGRLFPQPVEKPINIKAGKNIVACRNEYDYDLTVFFKGKTATLETFPAKYFFTGDDLVVYLTDDNLFKIFYEGIVYTIGRFNPGNLVVKDNLVTYSNELGYFMVFYKGETFQLENYVPEISGQSENSLFYVDASGRIKIFSFGMIEELPVDTYLSARLDYDVLQLETAPFQFRFYFKGKLF